MRGTNSWEYRDTQGPQSPHLQVGEPVPSLSGRQAHHTPRLWLGAWHRQRVLMAPQQLWMPQPGTVLSWDSPSGSPWRRALKPRSKVSQPGSQDHGLREADSTLAAVGLPSCPARAPEARR